MGENIGQQMASLTQPKNLIKMANPMNVHKSIKRGDLGLPEAVKELGPDLMGPKIFTSQSQQSGLNPIVDRQRNVNQETKSAPKQVSDATFNGPSLAQALLNESLINRGR